jgi:3-methyladenine DNA glycosylase AlkD
MNMKYQFISQLTEHFILHADSLLKPRQEAYMRNQFVFFGVNQTKRHAIQKNIFKAYPISTIDELTDIVKILWHLQTREYLYTAIDLLRKYKQLWNQTSLELFKYCILTDSWWDTVDNLATHCVGTVCVQFPKLIDIIDTWISADEMWVRRTALLCQLRYKTKTNTIRLFSYCEKTMHEKEFFIRKAIGWILREYSKTDPLAVAAFVTLNATILSPLSKREALKRIHLAA